MLLRKASLFQINRLYVFLISVFYTLNQTEILLRQTWDLVMSSRNQDCDLALKSPTTIVKKMYL